MANRNSTTSKSSAQKTSRRPENESLPARTGRTIVQRPYTSAAIATGAITAVAAAAAGAFFFSRRDKSIRESGAEFGTLVKDGIADATSRVKSMVGAGAEADQASTSERSQHDIAAEALALKESGSSATAASGNAEQSKVGSIAY